MAQHKASFTRFVPALLGLICAILLTITMVTCSGVADRTFSDWVPSDDYGERAFDTYLLASDDAPSAPDLNVTPPDWVVGVATEDATQEQPNRSHTHLTLSFDTGNVVLTYATDDIDDFLSWQLNEDTIITSHLFGGRYTDIEVGEPTPATMGGHPLTWGTYSFRDEYGRLNVCLVSACEVADGQVLTIVATETLREEGTMPFLSEEVLTDLWAGIAW